MFSEKFCGPLHLRMTVNQGAVFQGIRNVEHYDSVVPPNHNYH